jgi:ribosomal protein L37AE/L43A
MSFDEDPNDQIESHACPSCGGEVHISPDRTMWVCDDCEWHADDTGD